MKREGKVVKETDCFLVEEVAEGVYAALGADNSPAGSNAGIVDLGERTLVFDTFMTPAAGDTLREVAEQLTGREATYVINSHDHLDHWSGNQAFAASTTIIAPHTTHERMAEAAAYLNDCREVPPGLLDRLRQTESRLERETDARWRDFLKSAVARLRFSMDALSALEPRVPDQSFYGVLVLHGSKRAAEIHICEPGHSICDCFLVLGEERIAFLGDLALFEMHPLLTHGRPDIWCDLLGELGESGIDRFVPGHGPVGDRDDLALQRRYLTDVMELADTVIAAGGSVEDAAALPVPEPFDAWTRGLDNYESNLRLLHGLRSGDASGEEAPAKGQ